MILARDQRHPTGVMRCTLLSTCDNYADTTLTKFSIRKPGAVVLANS